VTFAESAAAAGRGQPGGDAEVHAYPNVSPADWVSAKCCFRRTAAAQSEAELSANLCEVREARDSPYGQHAPIAPFAPPWTAGSPAPSVTR
jgi:hypothetical protein